MDIHTLAREIFVAQPFSQHIGAELISTDENSAVIQVKIRDELKQQHGFVHGGVLSYLADNSITFAGGVALEGDALTSEFKINYLRPARGTALIARATTLSLGKRQAVCQAEIFAVDEGVEKCCAIAQGTVVRS